jgi:hypothetical protein
MMRFWHSTGVRVLSPHEFVGEAAQHTFYGYPDGYPDFYKGLHLRYSTYLDGIHDGPILLFSPV